MNNKYSLEKNIRKYTELVIPFHMPGHKQNSKYMIKHPEKIDVTEVQGTDNLHNPVSIINDAQNRAAKIYNTKNTFFLVNGSSSGLLAAIGACTEVNDHILIARNCHKSIYNALLINRLYSTYIYPQIIDKYGIFGGINPEDVDKILKKNSKIKAVVITSPTYEGFTSNIKEISDVVHKYGKILIVDEAHGAHFIFHKLFPKSALEQGADIVIQSLHKTLPSYTQTALLHVNSSRADLKRIKEQLSIYQTTSPSYIFMSSIDKCIELSSRENFFEKYINNLFRLRDKLSRLSTIKLLDEELLNNYYIQEIDFSKIVLIAEGEYSSGEIDNILRLKYNIQVEMHGANHLIAITSVGDSKKAYSKLYKALQEIDFNNNKLMNTYFTYDIIKDNIIKYPIHTAKEKNYQRVELIDSIGEISSQFITQYPPGIPIIVPGEIITKEVVNYVTKMKENNINFIGIENNKIQVIK